MTSIKLELLSHVCSGGQSEVYLGRCQGVFVVAKYFHHALDQAQEAACLQRLRHPSIIGLLGSSWDSAQAILVLEYTPGFTLRQALNFMAQERFTLSLNAITTLCAALMQSVGFIHAQGIIHNDLSPANILLGHEGDLKLCDFAMSLLPWQVYLGAPFGKIEYMAPELLRGQHPSIKSDFYAIAAIIFELVVGRCYEPGLSKKNELEVLRRPYPTLYSWVLEALRPMHFFRPQALPAFVPEWKDAQCGKQELKALLARMPSVFEDAGMMAHRIIEFIPSFPYQRSLIETRKDL